MNKDIPALILKTVSAQHGLITKNAKVTALEVDGYYVTVEGKLYFLTFERSCASIHDFKRELIKHVRNYWNFFSED